MKVFLDTNVLVAEALLGEGVARLVQAMIAARWRLYTSEHVLLELRRVLTEDLGFSERSAISACRRVLRRARLVSASESRHLVPGDDADTPVLRASLACGADYLVTNDRHLLALNPYQGLRVVSISDFAQVSAAEGRFN